MQKSDLDTSCTLVSQELKSALHSLSQSNLVEVERSLQRAAKVFAEHAKVTLDAFASLRADFLDAQNAFLYARSSGMYMNLSLKLITGKWN